MADGGRLGRGCSWETFVALYVSGSALCRPRRARRGGGRGGGPGGLRSDRVAQLGRAVHVRGGRPRAWRKEAARTSEGVCRGRARPAPTSSFSIPSGRDVRRAARANGESPERRARGCGRAGTLDAHAAARTDVAERPRVRVADAAASRSHQRPARRRARPRRASPTRPRNTQPPQPVEARAAPWSDRHPECARRASGSGRRRRARTGGERSISQEKTAAGGPARTLPGAQTWFFLRRPIARFEPSTETPRARWGGRGGARATALVADRRHPNGLPQQAGRAVR